MFVRQGERERENRREREEIFFTLFAHRGLSICFSGVRKEKAFLCFSICSLMRVEFDIKNPVKYWKCLFMWTCFVFIQFCSQSSWGFYSRKKFKDTQKRSVLICFRMQNYGCLYRQSLIDEHTTRVYLGPLFSIGTRYSKLW